MCIARIVRVLTAAACSVVVFAVEVLADVEAAENSPFVIGDVYQRNEKTLLYREYYYPDDSGLVTRVVYRLPDGELLAEKHLEHTGTAGVLSFKQVNYVADRSMGVTVEQGAAETENSNPKVEMFFRSAEQQTRVTVKVRDRGHLVVDAGFDPFIRHYWDSLVQGDEKSIQFPLSSRGRLLDMVVKVADCGGEKQASVCFRLRMRSLWLRWLVSDPVFVVYSRDTRKLSRYVGVGNITLADGSTPEIDIHFRYPPATGALLGASGSGADAIDSTQAASRVKLSPGS